MTNAGAAESQAQLREVREGSGPVVWGSSCRMPGEEGKVKHFRGQRREAKVKLGPEICRDFSFVSKAESRFCRV